MPWIKIFISIIAVGITFTEVWEFRRKEKNKKWGKLKKPIIIFFSLLLLLLTVWDEISDDTDNKIEEQRRSAQIIKDSIRASNIITNLRFALDKIDITAEEIGKSTENLSKVDSSIRLVNQGLYLQGNRLSRIISESEEVNKNLTGGDSYIKFYLLKNRKNRTIELTCGLTGKYPMHNIIINVTSSSFIDKLLHKSIELEPLINGRGIFASFSVNFQGFIEVNYPYTLAIFNENDLKKDLVFSFWTSSNNGTTFQKIEWKNHKQYFANPPKTNVIQFDGKMDWSGQSFEYYSSIDKLGYKDKKESTRIDTIAGIMYFNSHVLAYKVDKDRFTVKSIL